MTEKVLILDGNQRSALAATRSLGRKGIEVFVAEKRSRSLSGSSKYCKESIVYPSPNSNADEFIASLIQICIDRDIKVILPMTEITTHLVLKNRDKFSGIKVPFASFEAFELLSDKWKLFKLAQQLDIPIPATHFIETIGDLPAVRPQLKFPVVLKPYRSRIMENNRWVMATVKYANSLGEFDETVATTPYLSKHPFFIQEYIEGDGSGIFVLYDNAKLVIASAHKRIRERPPTGGASVLCESIKVDAKLLALSRKLLEHVNWHGVAMVEFKITKDGRPYLMEINARFWGSLQLAIDSEVDFPYLLYMMAVGKLADVEPKEYKVGTRSRWLLGDLDNLYLTVFQSNSLPSGSPSKLKVFTDFINFFAPDVKFEVNRWNDLKPFLYELMQYFLPSRYTR